MEASELRIGNITSHGTVYKINQETDADFNDTVGCMDFMGGIGEFELKDVNPIPLTEEKLLEFGFNKSGLYYLKDQVYVYIATGEHEAEFEYQFNHTQKPLFYVHELQNLFFALTGEELTI